MKNKLIVSQSILWATGLLIAALADAKQYTRFFPARFATLSTANFNKNSWFGG